MRARPCRRYITQEPTLAGVRVSDGIWVGAAFLTGFVVPMILKIHIYGVPGALIFSLAALLSSVAFFNWVRKKHRPKWLEHSIAYNLREISGNGNDLKRARVGRKRIAFLIDYADNPKNNWLASYR